jgi:hypothetical protein
MMLMYPQRSLRYPIEVSRVADKPEGSAEAYEKVF